MKYSAKHQNNTIEIFIKLTLVSGDQAKEVQAKVAQKR